MSVQPAYASAPIGFGPVNFATANTNRDGTGTIAQIAVGRAGAGTRVERVRVHAAVTTTAGMIRIYKKGTGLTLNADGSVASYSAPTWRLIYEIRVTAITASASDAAFDGEWAPTNGYMLAAYEQLGVSTHNAEAFNAEALGGHL
jgi:hypothetical protein